MWSLCETEVPNEKRLMKNVPLEKSFTPERRNEKLHYLGIKFMYIYIRLAFKYLFLRLLPVNKRLLNTVKQITRAPSSSITKNVPHQ